MFDPRSHLSPKYKKQVTQKQTAVIDVRSQFVERCYEVGGKDFVEAIAKYGYNERGEKLRLSPWYREYAELVGNLKVAWVLVSGSSQIGKTLCNTLLLCYCLTEGLSAVWAYDQQNSRDIQVNANFRPVIRHWLKAKGIEVKRSQGSQNNSLFQVKGAEAQFMYVSTSKKTEGNEGAAAGSNVVGVSRDILFKEERSQYPPGAGDPLNRRLDAGKLPSRPHRELGTPGAGNGIEAEIETAEYKFYPHYTCSVCGKTAPLHPKGCLLKPKDGRYLSLSGRPIDWHQKNGEACFGCSHCGAEIPQTARENALFRCLKTGIPLREFLDSLPKGIPSKRIKAGIILSPLLRIRQTNAAEEIIQEGLTTFNTDDWQQQGLGEPSESNFTGVTLDMLKKAIASTPPQGKPHFTICGIDQGRAEYWLVKCAYYLPDNWTELPFAQVIERSRRVIIFGGDITKGEVSDRISDCAFGIIDNEPDISAAIALSGETCLELGDQQSSMLDAVREGAVREGGNEHPCWKFRNEKFLKSVLTAFLMEMYSLPPEWEQWLGMKTERSPLVHLTAPSYNPSTGKWKRPKNHVDDLYYGTMFCEVGFYVYLSKYYSGGDVFEVGEERGIFESMSKF
jgi:hypothetical protein